MTSASYRFDRFRLDPTERRLTRDGAPVELNARYLDALVLLVREPGRLVSKDRFLDEVWKGVPVTDEALTQCIKALRRQLGDDAAQPRFIETVPKHGYRFIAQVGTAEAGRPDPPPSPRFGWRRLFLLGATGTLGGGVAGALGGLVYGFAGAFHQPGMGGVSVLLVLVALTVIVGLIGGAGVAFGIAAAGFTAGRAWAATVAGGALGGLVVGTVVKLLGLDAFDLLFGRGPGDITGPFEGIVIGAAVGLGASYAARSTSLRHSAAAAGLCGAAAGILIPLLGGRMMGGSLDALARHFPGSRLRLDQIGGLFGEAGFGTISQVVTGGLEGLLFGACVVGAMIIARRQLDRA